MEPGQNAERFLVRSGMLVTVLMLFGTALSSARVAAIVSGALLLGLLLYAAFGLREPARVRHKIIWAAVAAALAAGATAAGVVLLT